MKQDYKYAIYVLALATTVTLATGLLVVAGDTGTNGSGDEQLDDTTVELVGDLDALTDDEADRLPHLVWEDEAVRSYFDDPDGLEFEVTEPTTYDEDDDEFVPADDTVRVQVSPVDERLPYAFVTVDLDEDTASLEQGLHSVDDVDVEFGEGKHRLTDDERDRVAQILLDDPDVEWEIKTLLEEPATVDAAVVDREGDRVSVALTASDGQSSTVHADVDLASGSVENRSVSGALTVNESDSGSVAVDVEADGNGTYVLSGNASETISADATIDESVAGTAVEVTTSNETKTSVELDDVTVSLVEHRESLSEHDPEEFAALVWASEDVRRYFDDPERIEMDVKQDRELDAETGEFTPTDTMTVRVTPTDDRLPNAVAVVDPAAETVTVKRGLPALEPVDLEFTDETGLVTDADRDLIEDVVRADDAASYTIQSQFDDPDDLDATVTAATGDGPETVTMELAPPGVETASVSVTVDLENRTVTRSFVVIEALDSEVIDIEDSDYEIETAE
ncbi:hypothetical protein [Natrinema longum]|uniref:Uncharacterized protein n=1 Tax=Natrinema longum TaxID=370324 RepID=A0A8A2U9B1_9EURY|nr:hypothetical protein [Natrinema longum]MBZ6493376.1 hypothetical protein [Natrinema longum]QSW85276.1 hypothetical protein J0X27_00035 [Natrinema longum]